MYDLSKEEYVLLQSLWQGIRGAAPTRTYECVARGERAWIPRRVKQYANVSPYHR